jgi:hypothetical protein
MGWLLRHNWLWALLAFLLGSVITWALLVRREQGEARIKAERAGKTAEAKVSVLVGAGAGAGTSTGTPTAAPARRDLDEPTGGSPVAHVAGEPPKPVAVEPEQPVAGEEPVAVEEPAAAEVDVPAGDAPVSLAKRAPFSRRMETNGFAEAAEGTLFDLNATGDTTSGSASADPEPAPDVVPESAELAAPGQEDVVPAEADEVPPGRYGEGSADAVPHQSPPDGFTIKGKAQSMLFHTPDSPYYGRTKPDVWFQTEADAERAGFTKYVRRPRKSPGPKD